jgi:hypothetical protein
MVMEECRERKKLMVKTWREKFEDRTHIHHRVLEFFLHTDRGDFLPRGYFVGLRGLLG